MPSLFEPLNDTQKSRFQARYLQHLKGRNGHPDRSTHTFAGRERALAEVTRRPVKWSGPPLISAEDFQRNNSRHQPETDLNEATLWALAVSKINRSEQYGVERGFKDKNPENEAEDVEVYIEIEEFYHTRLLAKTLETLGLTMNLLPPNPFTRLVINAMVNLPDAMANVPILISERGAAVSFWLLIEKARSIFAAQPEVVARIELLLSQIMVDEVGHLHYIRSRLGRFGLGFAERSLKMIGGRLLKDLPELERLFGREYFLRQLLELDIDELAAAFPGSLDVAKAVA